MLSFDLHCLCLLPLRSKCPSSRCFQEELPQRPVRVLSRSPQKGDLEGPCLACHLKVLIPSVYFFILHLGSFSLTSVPTVLMNRTVQATHRCRRRHHVASPNACQLIQGPLLSIPVGCLPQRTSGWDHGHTGHPWRTLSSPSAKLHFPSAELALLRDQQLVLMCMWSVCFKQDLDKVNALV